MSAIKDMLEGCNVVLQEPTEPLNFEKLQETFQSLKAVREARQNAVRDADSKIDSAWRFSSSEKHRPSRKRRLKNVRRLRKKIRAIEKLHGVELL